uniref:Uncharacterized protein n=1 Tax=Strongyloides papillosus TaxID=174720 RepID=A0A0N5BKK4_STREA
MSKDQEKGKKYIKSSVNNDAENDKSEKDEKNTEKVSKESDNKDKVSSQQDEYYKTRKVMYDKLRLSDLGWRLHENSQYSRSKIRKLFYAGDDNALDYKFCLEFSGSDPWAAYSHEQENKSKSDDI